MPHNLGAQRPDGEQREPHGPLKRLVRCPFGEQDCDTNRVLVKDLLE